MAQSIHDYVVDSLRYQHKHGGLAPVSAATKVSMWSLLKIMYRQIENPGIKNIEPLFFYFKAREGGVLRRRGAA